MNHIAIQIIVSYWSASTKQIFRSESIVCRIGCPRMIEYEKINTMKKIKENKRKKTTTEMKLLTHWLMCSFEIDKRITIIFTNGTMHIAECTLDVDNRGSIFCIYIPMDTFKSTPQIRNQSADVRFERKSTSAKTNVKRVRKREKWINRKHQQRLKQVFCV